MTGAAEPSPPRWLLGSALVAVVLVVALSLRYGEALFAFFEDPAQLRAWLSGFGPAAPLALILLGGAQVVLAPIPGQVIGLVAGYLFGLGLGTLYSMLGLVLGSAVALWLSRRLGRPFVLRFVDEARLARWDALTRRWGPALFFVAFLLPGLPDDLLCFVIGLTSLRLGPMLVYAAVGRLPGMFAAAYVGAHASEVPTAIWVGAAVAGALVALLLVARGEALAEGIARRLGRGRSS